MNNTQSKENIYKMLSDLPSDDKKMNVLEQQIFDFLISNNIYNFDSKKLIGIEISQNREHKTIYINDKYLIEKSCTTHYNTIAYIKEGESFVFFQKGNTDEANRKHKEIEDFFKGKGFLRKLKINNFFKKNITL